MKIHAPIIKLSFATFIGILFEFASPCAHGDLLAQWHFDELGGTTAFDSVGSHDGALSAGGSSFVSGGISGNAISLNMAAGGYVDMGNNFSLLGTDFTIVFWVQTTTTLGDTIAVSKHQAGSANGYFFGINPTGSGGSPNKASFYASEPVGGGNGPTSLTSVNDGVWHQIVSVYDADGSNFIYVDGSPAEASTASISLIANTASFLVGGVSVGGTPTARYTGLVDELQIYNQTLTDTQIDFLFTHPAGVVPEPTTTSSFIAGAALLGGSLYLRRRRSLR
jgi:hypothetical protein